MKSGKVTLGYSSTLKSLRSGKAKLVIIAYETLSSMQPTVFLHNQTSKATSEQQVLIDI
jgi:large subunit ribosomal protein L30e